jgi:hypothetical protein
MARWDELALFDLQQHQVRAWVGHAYRQAIRPAAYRRKRQR